MLAVALLLFASARTDDDAPYYASYCCDGECVAGGCTIARHKFGVDVFYPVADCATCTSAFDNRTTALTTSCEFCDASGDSCSDATTNTGCAAPDASLVLFGFSSKFNNASSGGAFAELAAVEYCCYWLTDTPGRYDVA